MTAMGRPPASIPEDARKWRGPFYLPPDVLARLDKLAARERRKVPDEIAKAIEAYVAAGEFPEDLVLDQSPGATRFQIDAEPVRQLDRCVGERHREAHLIEAVTRWVRR